MMDDVNSNLKRTASHHSTSSQRSQRSQTVRIRSRKYASYMSSSASSIVSDKSLTSFPSFSPESPKDERHLPPRTSDAAVGISRKSSDPVSIVESLTAASPSLKKRAALFDDAPLTSGHIPGAIHHASDEHVERLIARNGAVALVRQIAGDLAQRDAQISSLRRKGEERERALRKIILECGLSSLDLETRLRAIEAEQRTADDSGKEVALGDAGLEDMMSDAMSDAVVLGDFDVRENDATIRASDALRALQDKQVDSTRGWKDYIWGTSRKSSRASSPNRDASKSSIARNGVFNTRPTVLENDFFQPPEATGSASRGSSIQSRTINSPRKPSSSFAAFALKLVAGNTNTPREDVSARGRASSAGTPSQVRAASSASSRTTKSAVSAPKVIPSPRKFTRPTNLGPGGRGVQQDRWDTMGASPQNITSEGNNTDNYGPVEMDTILPLDAQPPTVTQPYNNQYNPEFLTDRFGFIYDQRRKKRQKEAADRVQKNKRGSRIEMLNGARNGISPISADIAIEDLHDDRPDTPISIEEDGKPAKRWQDYLKIATFPTELLSHTPSGSIPAFEVMEGSEIPRSPVIIPEERGFLPSASTTVASPALSVVSDDATLSKPIPPASPTEPPLDPISPEDTEPVKILLKQLGELHDSLQREKTVKWNDFLRKVRAERKRDGEAAAAAHAADKNPQRPISIMPEASLQDGEIIGVAGLGNKGKVGRAKWNDFKTLVLGGIPVSYRAKIWAECSGAAAFRIPGYYDDLVAQSEADDDPSIVAQIKMDINRTLTDNIFFRKGPGVAKLNEVLVAYSRRNAEVGYCQGMNLITACLLLIMPTAEDTFWLLTSIIENILPRGYYDHSLMASRADQQVLRQYVTEILPKLSSHLDDLSIELEALTFQWFLSVFTDCLSAEALFRVWDVVFCTNDGSTFLFQVALALLKLNEQQLLQCSTPASVYTYINHQMTNHAISIDGLIHASDGLRNVVKREEMENRRTKAIEAEEDLIRQRERSANLKRAQRSAATNTASVESQADTSTAATSMIEEEIEDGELAVRTPKPVEEDMELGID
jgi:hypothetical protein